MALSRDTIKLVLFAGLCVAMVLTLYFVSKRSSVNEKFANGVPPLGKAVPPFGCKQVIDKAMAKGPEAIESLTKKNAYCADDDMCCDYISNFWAPDMLITNLINAAKQAGKLPYEILAMMMMSPPPPQTDKLTGEQLPPNPDDVLPIFRLIKRMQDLNIPVNGVEYSTLKKAAKAADSPKATAKAAAGEPAPNFNYDKSGTSITGFDQTSKRKSKF